MVPIAQIDVARIRLKCYVRAIFGSIETLRVGHVERVQHQRIQHAEHHRVRANRQRQRHHCSKRKSLRLAQNPQRKLHILHERLHEVPAERRVALFFVVLAAPKLDPSAPFRLQTRQPIALQIVGSTFDVQMNLFVHLRRGLIAAKPLHGNGSKT